MKVRALTNFSGIITMSKGQEKDIKRKLIYDDLLQVGYVEKVSKITENTEEDIEENAEVKTDEN